MIPPKTTRALGLLLTLTTLVCAAPAAAQPETPYHTAGESELFVDDALLAEVRAVERVIHQARKLDQPVFEPENPAERNRVYIYGVVHREPETGQFRMWYNARGGLRYAESSDGIRWERPSIGLHEHDGSTDNNLVLPGYGNATVFVDEDAADPSKRYKALFGTRDFYRGAYSADGIHWTMYNDGGRLIPFGSELSTVNRDPVTGEYLAFIRSHPPKLHPTGVKQKRTCSLTTSRDFVNWTEPRLVITPDAMDDRGWLGPDQRTEFYGWSGFRYGSQYLGFLTVFRVTGLIPEHPPSQSAWDGPIDVQLIHSRDGRDWHRTVDRTPVVPNGPHAYDAGTILHVANNPIIVGDEVWLYYTAINTTHGGPMPPKRITIALAKWDRDRFVSLRARWALGSVQTVPMTGPGGALRVNADAADGELRVGVLDAGGQPVPGFSAEDCDPITTDALDHAVTWADGRTLADAVGPGQPFALRFEMTRTHLYSFRVGDR